VNERDIFLEAIEKESPEERRSFLDRTCGEDAQLRSRLDLLLQSHEHPNSLLDDFVRLQAEQLLTERGIISPESRDSGPKLNPLPGQ